MQNGRYYERGWSMEAVEINKDFRYFYKEKL